MLKIVKRSISFYSYLLSVFLFYRLSSSSLSSSSSHFNAPTTTHYG